MQFRTFKQIWAWIEFELRTCLSCLSSDNPIPFFSLNPEYFNVNGEVHSAKDIGHLGDVFEDSLLRDLPWFSLDVSASVLSTLFRNLDRVHSSDVFSNADMSV